uniref:Uncharacterized protein n=1 Tax=Proboscia inermis TaxID=420281 RepID=A0A7S0CG07_9STRA|mmetsp:Transcript_46059/g.46536  ORF Transcript_46059/g.46536 Transcript_46059/m.46536 type:complete len:113 (+) Transcript_46059:205-543(+)
MTCGENPDADRTPIFFAIARVMPSVVKYLIAEAKACFKISVTGRFRLVSDPKKSFHGTFTPAQFARQLKKVELHQKEAKLSCGEKLHPYYLNRLDVIIRLLSEVESKEKNNN